MCAKPRWALYNDPIKGAWFRELFNRVCDTRDRPSYSLLANDIHSKRGLNMNSFEWNSRAFNKSVIKWILKIKTFSSICGIKIDFLNIQKMCKININS